MEQLENIAMGDPLIERMVKRVQDSESIGRNDQVFLNIMKALHHLSDGNLRSLMLGASAEKRWDEACEVLNVEYLNKELRVMLDGLQIDTTPMLHSMEKAHRFVCDLRKMAKNDLKEGIGYMIKRIYTPTDMLQEDMLFRESMVVSIDEMLADYHQIVRILKWRDEKAEWESRSRDWLDMDSMNDDMLEKYLQYQQINKYLEKYDQCVGKGSQSLAVKEQCNRYEILEAWISILKEEQVEGWDCLEEYLTKRNCFRKFYRHMLRDYWQDLDTASVDRKELTKVEKEFQQILYTLYVYPIIWKLLDALFGELDEKRIVNGKEKHTFQAWYTKLLLLDAIKGVL